MATESPLLHDGSQTVASANYGNGAALAGSNTGGTTGGATGSGQYLAVLLSTAADRTSVLASAIGQQIYGILQNKPGVGQAADVGIFGVSKAVSGGAITRGNPLMVNASGQLIQWTAGSAYAQVGYAIESAVSGQIFAAFIGATSPKVLT